MPARIKKGTQRIVDLGKIADDVVSGRLDPKRGDVAMRAIGKQFSGARTILAHSIARGEKPNIEFLKI